jgi:hypothetical protein
MDIAEPTLSPAGDERACPVLIQISQGLATVDVGDHCPDRHAQLHIVAALAIAIRTTPILTFFGAKNACISKVDKRIEVSICHRPDTAAASAIAAIGSAQRDIFFATERSRAIAAIAGKDLYLGFVKKFHPGIPKEKALSYR